MTAVHRAGRGRVREIGCAPDGDPTAARQAMGDAAPFALALVPFGLAIGGASATAGLSTAETMFAAVALLAGAAQLAAVEVIGSGGGVLVTAVVVALVNLRFVFYGAGVAGWFTPAPFRRRLLLAFPIIDQTFMLCQERFDESKDLDWRQRYYLTATLILAGTFITSQLIAFKLGTSLPEGLGLHLAAPLAFVGMLAKAIAGSREIVVGASAGLALLLTAGVAGTAALPIAVLVGVAAGTAKEGRS